MQITHFSPRKSFPWSNLSRKKSGARFPECFPPEVSVQRMKQQPTLARIGESCVSVDREAAFLDRNRKRLDNVFVRDFIIGFSDGLTVPFALAAGLSSLGSSRLVVIGGLAELFSGAISMGVGGYFSTKAERDNYRYLLRQTREHVQKSCSHALQREVFTILSPYGVTAEETRHIIRCLETADDKAFEKGAKESEGLTTFLLRFGEGVNRVASWRVYASALTIGLAYLVGGLIPMIPYLIVQSSIKALYISIAVTGVIFLLFGGIKGYLTGSGGARSWLLIGPLQTLAIGTVAAGAAYGIARALNTESHIVTS